MTLSKTTRRKLLKLGLGAGSVALLDRLGVPLVSPGRAKADPGIGPGSGKPTKLLTIYVAGGWVPMYLWCPLSASEIASHIPPPTTSNIGNSETCFYTPAQVDNVDGSGDALDAEGYQRLRIPRTWDEAALLNNETVDNEHKGWSWAYPNWQVWNRCNVVHGVDKQTAAHQSAKISTLCGIPGPNFASPSLHAWVAHAMASVYGDDRPLGSVNIGNTLLAPAAAGLPPGAAPVSINSLGDLAYFLAETKDTAWKGLRNRILHQQSDFFGVSVEPDLPTNDMDELVLARTADLTGSANDALFQKIYDTYRTTSKQLALDLVTVLQNTPGLDDTLEIPYWYNHFIYQHFFTKVGGQVFGIGYTPQFDLALRLLRSNLCTSVHVRVGDRYHDDHSAGHLTHYPFLRADFEMLGRMLAYMDMIPSPSDPEQTLLDDTLVLIFSEFGRTWPMSKTCDHWPGDAVCFAGGNVHGNRMIGGYDLSTGPANGIGFMGKNISLIDEGLQDMTRQPWSRDVIFTALHMFGVPNVFLPGGPGRIVGVEED